MGWAVYTVQFLLLVGAALSHRHIVGFSEYQPAVAHEARLTDILGGPHSTRRSTWRIVPRPNRQYRLRTDFLLVEFMGNASEAGEAGEAGEGTEAGKGGEAWGLALLVGDRRVKYVSRDRTLPLALLQVDQNGQQPPIRPQGPPPAPVDVDVGDILDQGGEFGEGLPRFNKWDASRAFARGDVTRGGQAADDVTGAADPVQRGRRLDEADAAPPPPAFGYGENITGTFSAGELWARGYTGAGVKVASFNNTAVLHSCPAHSEPLPRRRTATGTAAARATRAR
jgi:hypothetical protein